MPKITSSSTYWKGSVTIFDQLTLSQVELIEEAQQAVGDLLNGKAHKKINITSLDKPKLKAIMACVETWEISAPEGKPPFPASPNPADFPMTPRRQTHELIDWIFSAVWDVYTSELEVPNK